MLDAFFFRMLLAALAGWLDQRQQDAVAYLIEGTVSCVGTCPAVSG